MARTIPPTDVLVTLMGSPHESDRTTSALRLVQALLEKGRSVQVWTCGNATLLTQNALGEDKPRNLANWNGEYPSTAALVKDMLETFPGRLYWYGCRFCSDDRGAADHLPQVVMRPPSGYGANVAAAGRTLLVGVL
jgi:sulfur relay (sulfurtransferase) complex TusBCD TusD component (DsrE family)